MAYIANTDIETRVGSAAYVQLADDDGDNVADTAVVDEVRLAAEGEVNSYLARRYAVPIDLTAHADLADVLKSITLDLAEFRLRVRRPPVSQELLQRRDDAAKWLRGIAEGAIALPSTSEPATSPTRSPLGEARGEDRVLTRDELADH